jgi:amino acid transporter
LTEKPTVFVREATGLVRQFSWVQLIILNFAVPNLAAGALFAFGLAGYLFPGADMVFVFVVLQIVLLAPAIIAYSMMTASAPRSGGDYVFVSRFLTPSLGSAVALVWLMFADLFGMGLNTVISSTFIMSPMITTIGTITNQQALTKLGSLLEGPTAGLTIGSVLIIATLLLLIIPIGKLSKILLGLFIVAFLGYPLLYTAVLAFASQPQFITAFNSYAHQIGVNASYLGVIESAKTAGATIASPSLAASFSAVPMLMLIIGLANASAYVGGETKHATRQQPIALIGGLVASSLLLALMAFFTYRVFGYGFIEATGYYAFSGATGWPLPVGPYPNFFEAILVPNVAFNTFMLISGLAWQLVGMIMCALVASRIILAWSFDGVIPYAFSNVDNRFHTPIMASILVLIGATIFMVLSVYGLAAAFYSGMGGVTTVYIIDMVAAALFPFTAKNLFKQAPEFVRKKIGPLPVVTILGGIGFVAITAAMYLMLTIPAAGSLLALFTVMILALYGVGVVIYYASRAYRKRKGMNLDFAYKEIPPE